MNTSRPYLLPVVEGMAAPIGQARKVVQQNLVNLTASIGQARTVFLDAFPQASFVESICCIEP